MKQPPPTAPAARGKRTLLWIGLAVLAPVVLSYAFYYLFPRDSFVNYGELLPVGPVHPVQGTTPDGKLLRLDDLKGHWTMVVAAGGACDTTCSRMLYAMRQSRTMQGKAMDRVERLWLVTDDAALSAAMLEEHPGLIIARTTARQVEALPRGSNAVYLLDPLGNQVLAWPRDPDIKALAKDLARLLKASRIG